MCVLNFGHIIMYSEYSLLEADENDGGFVAVVNEKVVLIQVSSDIEVSSYLEFCAAYPCSHEHVWR